MPYKGSYVWSIRQKIDHDLLIIPSSDVVAVRDDGRLLLVHNNDFGIWSFPGGYPEEGQTSDECAARELYEEGGLEVIPSELIPIAFVSGHFAGYPNGDIIQPFTQVFLSDNWRDTSNELDVSEVSERKWLSVEELNEMELHPRVERIIQAYSDYIDTGKYQMINMKAELIDAGS